MREGFYFEAVVDRGCARVVLLYAFKRALDNVEATETEAVQSGFVGWLGQSFG